MEEGPLAQEAKNKNVKNQVRASKKTKKINPFQSRVRPRRRKAKTNLPEDAVNSQTLDENKIPQTHEQKFQKKKKKHKTKKESIKPPAAEAITFTLDEITNNKEASALISELVKCYTGSSNLPENELDALNKTLYDKTVSLFLNVLNNSVEKIYNKLLSIATLKEQFLVIKSKKDASCQTDIS